VSKSVVGTTRAPIATKHDEISLEWTTRTGHCSDPNPLKWAARTWPLTDSLRSASTVYFGSDQKSVDYLFWGTAGPRLRHGHGRPPHFSTMDLRPDHPAHKLSRKIFKIFKNFWAWKVRGQGTGHGHEVPNLGSGPGRNTEVFGPENFSY